MIGRIPDFIEPIRLAKKGESLAGQVDLDSMDRLSSMLASGDSGHGCCNVQLAFGIDIAGIRNIQGRIQADVTLTCQRCLKPMNFTIISEVSLGIIRNRDQAGRLPDHYDPLLVESDEISLTDILEDELILAMPATPLHDINALKEAGKDTDKCQSPANYTRQKTADKDNTNRKNPFAVLADLKQTLKNKK